MVEKVTGYLEYIFAGITAVAIMWVTVWKSINLDKEFKKHKEGVDKTMTSLTEKVDYNNKRVILLEKNFPIEVFRLKKWASDKFTHVEEMREKHKEIKAEFAKLEDIITEQRSDKIKSQNAIIKSNDEKMIAQQKQINELLIKLKN